MLLGGQSHIPSFIPDRSESTFWPHGIHRLPDASKPHSQTLIWWISSQALELVKPLPFKSGMVLTIDFSMLGWVGVLNTCWRLTCWRRLSFKSTYWSSAIHLSILHFSVVRNLSKNAVGQCHSRGLHQSSRRHQKSHLSEGS